MRVSSSGIKRAGLAACVVIGSATVVLAQDVARQDGRSSTLPAWTWDPLIAGFLLPSALVYVFGAWRMRRTPLVSRWRSLAFIAGWLTLVVALLSPVHRLSAMLLSVHMTQHELLMLVAAPLMVMSRPLVLMLWALPRRARLMVGQWTRTSVVSRSWHVMTGPFTVWAFHAAVLWIWHIPMLYEAALSSEAVHALQHSAFFVSASLFWWVLTSGRYGRMGYGISVAYVFTTAMHTGLLGALMTFAHQLWYATYEGRTAAWGLTALEDQQLAGLLMWVPGGVVLTLVGLGLFAAWLGEAERRVQISAFPGQTERPHLDS